ncbi:DNA cytosine methyltransferase [Priestia flexa]|uniref:DNA cytosine methyltransferase n=1 Tax=Priestia flexa TaxID=86664 RepID=UPI000474416E|nr:DNA cytosine methyltransferase [Priestia flexa]
MEVVVLSLFDGMSCGQIALERAGIKIKKYYASEVNKPSIKVTQKNYPNTIQLGDITKLTDDQLRALGQIDYLIGGSPCQNLSPIVIGNEEHGNGLEGIKSKLFYEYIRVLRIVKPKYFLLENVEGMKGKDKEIITLCMGVEPIMIDSGLVSAQERKRYYWTNIPNIQQPPNKGLVLKDIMEEEVDEKYFYTIPYQFFGLDRRIAAKLDLYNYDMLQRVYSPYFQAPCLTGCRGGHKQKKVMDNGRPRKLTPTEYERLQTVPENYTEGVADGHRYNMLGDGWTVDVIAWIFSHTPKEQSIHNKAI